MKALLVSAAAATLLAACSSSAYRLSANDPDVPLAGGNPMQPAYSMSSAGFDPSPVLRPAEQNQDKLRSSAGP